MNTARTPEYAEYLSRKVPRDAVVVERGRLSEAGPGIARARQGPFAVVKKRSKFLRSEESNSEVVSEANDKRVSRARALAKGPPGRGQTPRWGSSGCDRAGLRNETDRREQAATNTRSQGNL